MSFEKATRVKLRFSTESGLLSVEQLWSLKYDKLVELETSLTETVEKYGKRSRRQAVTRSAEQELDELRLEIVTHILNVKDTEAAAAANAAQAKAHNEKIYDLIKEREDAELRKKVAEMPLDQLRSLLV